jgi:hypothetical protein
MINNLITRRRRPTPRSTPQPAPMPRIRWY